mmetsp:Transcript_7252/g.14933  ORF Transcript_7252/g.14933 Transcript_7252/m.14933 type:complete len:93 (-) Transcript_7252:14-292(-)
MMSLDHHLLLEKIRPMNYIHSMHFSSMFLQKRPPLVHEAMVATSNLSRHSFQLQTGSDNDTCDVFWSSFIPANGGMVTCRRCHDGQNSQLLV